MTIKSKPKIQRVAENYKWWLKSVPEVNTWTDVNILRFLQLYKSFPILWNAKDPEYKNESKRLSAYKLIAETLKLKNVDEDSCMKLVETLKRRYVWDREIPKNATKEQRPVWFGALDSIIRRAFHSLNAIDVQSRVSIDTSFADCKDCCEKQDLVPPCNLYHSSQEDLKTEESKESIKSFKKCYDDKDTCSSSKSVKFSQEHLDKECMAEQKAHNEGINCHTLTKNNMDQALKDFSKCFSNIYQLISFEIEARDEDCDCKTDESVEESNKESSENSRDSKSCAKSDEDDCLCKFINTKESNSSSSRSSKNFRPQDFSIYRVGNANARRKKSDSKSLSNNVSNTDESVKSENEKSGLFVDSVRFMGKRISLVDVYVRNERNGDEELVEPRRHFAPCDYDQSQPYPLQLEM